MSTVFIDVVDKSPRALRIEVHRKIDATDGR